jgi:hypothetical protein
MASFNVTRAKNRQVIYAYREAFSQMHDITLAFCWLSVWVAELSVRTGYKVRVFVTTSSAQRAQRPLVSGLVISMVAVFFAALECASFYR